MKNIFASLLLIFALSAFSQPRTIEVQGFGDMKVAPDEGVLYISIQAHQMAFGKATEALTKKEQQVLKRIEKLGFKTSDVRTTNFSVREHTIWRNGTRYDSGYIASQAMHIEFPNKKEKIAKIINAFSEGKLDAEINFGFKLSDELMTETSEKVIELAVADGKKKADLLAKYSGVSIKNVLSIKYHVEPKNDYPMYEAKMSYAMDMSESARNGSQGFQAEDITVSDNVVIFYEIE